MKILERLNCSNCSNHRCKYKLLSENNIISYSCFICKNNDVPGIIPAHSDKKILIEPLSKTDQTTDITELQKNDKSEQSEQIELIDDSILIDDNTFLPNLIFPEQKNKHPRYKSKIKKGRQ